VLEAMLPYFGDVFGNASSMSGYGREARSAIDRAREQVAALVNADVPEITFTSGGTESDNLALKGVAYSQRKKGNHIITTQIEHHAVLHTCQFLEKHEGFRVTYLPVDRHGMVDPDDLRAAITDDTILVSIMHANNEVGTIQPIAEIGAITRERSIPLHVDAVQSVGKIPVDVKAMSIDLLSLSAHKIYGPKGVGALYVRRGTRMVPLMHGGHHERNRRAGTENVPGIVGLGKAAEIAQRDMAQDFVHVRTLRDALHDKIVERVERVHLNGHPTERLPGTLNLSFEAVEGESMILSLDLEGVAISSGSACTSGTLEPSHVLTAMGVPPELSQTALRFSPGRGNTMEDIELVADLIPPSVERLRMMSALEPAS
jgi:cysteine desulfurase